MSKVASNLPPAPEGCRWATMSRPDPKTGEYWFRVKADGKVVCEVEGHVVCAIPVTAKAAKAVLEAGGTSKYYDPVKDEEFQVSGVIARAASLVKHDSESGRGTVRQKAADGVKYSLEGVQAEVLGTAKHELTEDEVLKAQSEGAEALLALLKAHGKIKN